ncbi:MAG: ribosome maturation factor RimM [Micromonosporaceae bacterium]|nr:ribosome maturation factor RimM [Micromonosporaceae bacterium]
MLLTVGRIVRPHGVRGEVLVEISTDEPEQRYAVGATLVAGEPSAGRRRPPDPPPPESLTIEALRPHQGRLIVTFQGVADRDAADRLRGLLLYVDSATLTPPTDPDEFHDQQLVGLAAVSPAGERLGEVTRVDHGSAADRLVVARPDGRTALVPFVAAIVPEVDLAGGRVVVDPPPGLLDL